VISTRTLKGLALSAAVAVALPAGIAVAQSADKDSVYFAKTKGDGRGSAIVETQGKKVCVVVADRDFVADEVKVKAGNKEIKINSDGNGKPFNCGKDRKVAQNLNEGNGKAKIEIFGPDGEKSRGKLRSAAV
jgi:hypothetical protein